MNSPSSPQLVRRQVEAAIASSWPEFEKDHPALAAVIDQELFYVTVVQNLSEDADFVAAYRAATQQNAASAVLGDILQAAVRRALLLLK